MANTNTTTGKITPGNAVGMGAAASPETLEKTVTKDDQHPELEVKLTKKTRAELDLPQESTEPATQFPDHSKRKETGFEATVD